MKTQELTTQESFYDFISDTIVQNKEKGLTMIYGDLTPTKFTVKWLAEYGREINQSYTLKEDGSIVCDNPFGRPECVMHTI